MKKIFFLTIILFSFGIVNAQFPTTYSYKQPTVEGGGVTTWCLSSNTAVIHNVDNGGIALQSAGLVVCNECDTSSLYLNLNWDEFEWTDNATLYGGGYSYLPSEIEFADGNVLWQRTFVKTTAGDIFYFPAQSNTVVCEGGGTPVPPTVYTCAGYPDVTESSADVCGQVVDIGTSAITSYGFAYSRNPGVTISDSIISGSGSATEGYTATISGLDENTTYYFAAYAESDDGIGYGSELSFTTGISCTSNPTVEFISFPGHPESATSTTIEISTSVISDCNITARGYYYSTSPNPDSGDNVWYSASTTGIIYETITGLSPGTGYYFTAFAENSYGTHTIEYPYRVFTKE